ncbi:MAG TPA: polysaccharide biosynthesis/export family protein [Gemmatimonadaceae bacterium]|nr:polysaccharide biosynthesis/export family protein [Gemmatimonadaceae bacterium]
MPLRTRLRDAAERTSRSRTARAVRAGAFLTFAGAVACTPAVPRSAGIAPVPRGAYTWLVEPGDVIRLKNWSAPEQSGDLLVNERGIVLVPTVGHLAVQGLTPDSLEQRIVRAFAGRIDPSRVDVQLIRPITVTGGVKNPSVQLVDGSASVLSIIAKSGGTIRPGGDSRVFVVRTNEPTREVSVADHVSDLGIRASDQLYVQDPPFVVRNELAIRSAYELVQFGLGLLTIYYLIRRD